MNNRDYNKLFDAVKYWLEAKEVFEQGSNLVLGRNPGFYFWIFAILFTIAHFNEKKPAKEEQVAKEYIVNPKYKASNFILYEKPDNRSNILLQMNSSISVTILAQTKYYYKVEIDKDGQFFTGYIKKENISQ
jgi:hypothetical protein